MVYSYKRKVFSGGGGGGVFAYLGPCFTDIEYEHSCT
jgi:hypothetical protein